MSDKQEVVQKFIHDLESGAPNRDITIQSLVVMIVKKELEMLRTLGTAGYSIDTPSIVSALLNVLSQDDDPGIRSYAAKWLGEIARDILRYKTDLQTVTRTSGTEIKPLLDVPKNVEQGLVSALKDENPKIQKAAAKALRKIGTPSALEAVPPKPWWKFW